MRLTAATLMTLSALVALVALVATAPIAVAAPTPHDSALERLDVYAGDVSRGQLAGIVALGIDREDVHISSAAARRSTGGSVHVEAILTGRQVQKLHRKGIDLAAKRVDGKTAAQRATARAAAGMNVFKKYAGPGGLKEEFEQAAAAHPRIAKLVRYGTTVDGQDIVALKVTKTPNLRHDRRPAVLYLGAQHAREWITPEMVRRLMHYLVDGYATNAAIRKIVDSTQLWLIPVANPDGYDWTFEPGQRLWRKNLRDNDDDGQITDADGVDPNRNFPTKWGYDNEGSSPDITSETYRGTSPGSEPETQGLDDLARRIGFKFDVNYHSAAELLLYGTSWQVDTPTPDDVISEAMAGDDAHSAIPGYDPDIGAELYTTNGETDTHLTERYGTLSFTPEMSTCETASDSNPNDQWDAADCDGNVFAFPDDEALIQAEFEKNLPFALSVARSAHHPDDPDSVVGRKAEDFRIVHSFDVSYGSPQTVSVVAKRSLRQVQLHYRITRNNRRVGGTQTARVREWAGGERYGAEDNTYYAELRGTVRGARAGDRVEVWFSGLKPGKGWIDSKRFSYALAKNSGARVLVIANEDYKGVNPTYPAGTNAPKYAGQYAAAIEAAGYDADVWDVDAQGVPSNLGVLSHYDAVVWYLGDNRLTQDPEDELISTPFGELPDIGVAERQQYLTLAVRDYLNEGGKLIHAGEMAQYEGLPGISDFVGGLYYGLNGDPTAECVVTSEDGFFDDCLLLADDFRQYYLGAYTRTSIADQKGVTGVDTPINGYTGTLGGPVVEGDNPLDEAGAFQSTSEVLPPDEFPQFASHPAAEYALEHRSPFAPIEGQRYAGAVHADESYMRLQKTVDLTNATSAQLQFQLSLNAEPGYDHLIVEAHTVGQDDWTTLPDLNGGTSTDSPAQCTDDPAVIELHPFLSHYLGAGCLSPGSSGTWNSFTGSTGGWRQVAFDLAPYAGKQVELSISYVTDQSVGGVGAFVDDTRVVVDGVTAADGFEGATSGWTPAGAPEGSPPNSGDWQIGEQLVNIYAGTATDDTLLLGFGLEQLATDDDREQLLSQALGGLIGG